MNILRTLAATFTFFLFFPHLLFSENAVVSKDSIVSEANATKIFEKAFSCEGATFQPASEFPKAVLALQQAYEASSAFQSKFTQESFLAALEVREESHGKIWYSKPGKMKWHYEDPEEKTFLLVDDQYSLVEYVDEQVIQGRVRGIFLSDLPVAFLLGLGRLEESFEGKTLCTFSDGREVFTLVPKNKSSDQEQDGLTGIRFQYKRRGSLPDAVELLDSAGNANRFLFTDRVVHKALPLSTFQLEAPKHFDRLQAQD
jgi:outer membrane lipoprotein carrier protein